MDHKRIKDRASEIAEKFLYFFSNTNETEKKKRKKNFSIYLEMNP